MATKAKYEPVVFEDAQGNPISNDPVWLAQQTLKNAGMDDSDDSDDDLTEDYSSVKGKDLIDLAKERGVEFQGKKAGDVRQALIDQDAQASVVGNDAEDEEDDEQ